MSFVVRAVKHEDIGQLVDLAKQFTLLNLPGEKNVLAAKIDRSFAIFCKEIRQN